MKAVIITEAGAEPHIANGVSIPNPGEGQVLVKSVYSAINPVDTIMAQTGAMVRSYPFSPGCDAGGAIVSLGPNAVSSLGRPFEIGNRVCGCARLGTRGYSTWSEYFLMDVRVAIPVPPNIKLEEAGGLGVGLLTAAEGVFSCLGLAVRTRDVAAFTGNETVNTKSTSSWALVFGGASSVGLNAVQLLLACGFRVVATCSERSNPLLEGKGVVCVPYALGQDELINEIVRLTEGRVRYMFDAVGTNNSLTPRLVEALGAGSGVLFTTTNAFEPLPVADGLTAKAIQLGPIGQPGVEVKRLNNAVSRHIPVLCGRLESGSVKAGPYLVQGEGLGSIAQAWEVQKRGKVAGKVVVKIADE